VELKENKTNTPEARYTEQVFGDGTQLLGFSAQGIGHNVPLHETLELEFYGIQ